MEIGADWAVCVRAIVFCFLSRSSLSLSVATWQENNLKSAPFPSPPDASSPSFLILSLSLSLFRFGRLTTSTTPGRPLITRAQSAVAAAAVKATHINRLSLSLPKSIKLYVSNYTLQRNSIQIWNEFGAPSLRMINAYQNKKKKEKMHTNNHVTVSYARNRGGCYAIG